jgi:hypothetical protein
MVADELKSKVKVCMFDQYGTVVDMQTGLVKVATPFLRAKGWQGNPNSFVTWWRRTHFENSMIDALLHREHTPYREIGERSVAERDGSRGDQLLDGGGAGAGGQHRAAAAVSRGARGAGPAADALSAGGVVEW